MDDVVRARVQHAHNHGAPGHITAQSMLCAQTHPAAHGASCIAQFACKSLAKEAQAGLHQARKGSIPGGFDLTLLNLPQDSTPPLTSPLSLLMMLRSFDG